MGRLRHGCICRHHAADKTITQRLVYRASHADGRFSDGDRSNAGFDLERARQRLECARGDTTGINAAQRA